MEGGAIQEALTAQPSHIHALAVLFFIRCMGEQVHMEWYRL